MCVQRLNFKLFFLDKLSHSERLLFINIHIQSLGFSVPSEKGKADFCADRKECVRATLLLCALTEEIAWGQRERERNGESIPHKMKESETAKEWNRQRERRGRGGKKLCKFVNIAVHSYDYYYTSTFLFPYKKRSYWSCVCVCVYI